MGISDKIEAFIIELMKDEADYTEFGRNELADIFGCVPSQINYVISTRFSPERGYVVESRRGGGGYIKIKKVELSGFDEVISAIGKSCDFETARSVVNYLYKENELTQDAAKVLLSATSDNALVVKNPERDIIRANILKTVICNL